MNNTHQIKNSSDDIDGKEKGTDQEGILDSTTEPSDGGYGWVIVAVCFILNLIAAGIKYSSAIFFQSLILYFDATLWDVAWISSFCGGTAWFCGPVFSVLIDAYGFRAITIAGAIISSCALILTTLSPCVEIVIFLSGFLLGFGIGCIQTCSSVCTGYYFTKRRALASGIAVSGCGMGIFFIPILNEILIENYEWQGAMILLSGLTLNCAVLGALLRPPKINTKELKTRPKTKLTHCKMYDIGIKNSQEMKVDIQYAQNVPGNLLSLSDTNINKEKKDLLLTSSAIDMNESVTEFTCHLPKTKFSTSLKSLNSRRDHCHLIDTNLNMRRNSKNAVNFIDKVELCDPKVYRKSICLGSFLKYNSYSVEMSSNDDLKTQHESLHDDANQRVSPLHQNIQNYILADQEQTSVSNKLYDKIKTCHEDVNKPLHYKDSSYQLKAYSPTRPYNSSADTSSHLSNVSINPVNNTKLVNNQKLSYKNFIPSAALEVFHKFFDTKLFKNLKYSCLCFACLLGCAGDIIPYIYFPQNALEEGISSNKAAFLISFMGIGDVLGRMFFGCIGNWPRFQVMAINNFSWLISGILMCFMAFACTYRMMILQAFAFGFTIGGPYAVITPLLVEINGLNKLLSSFGWLYVFQGIGATIGPPLAALLSALLGENKVIHIFGGTLLITACFIMFLATKLK